LTDPNSDPYLGVPRIARNSIIAMASGCAYKMRSVMPTADVKAERVRRIDPWWRKARIAARLLLKKQERKTWNSRDRRLAEQLAEDPGVTNRLIDQAVSFCTARKNGHRLLDR
jgi:hypothetical protein